MVANLELLINAKDQASGVLKSVDKAASGLGNTMGTGLKMAGLAAATGLGAAIFAGISFVKQAAEEEAGIRRLAAAVDANGGSWAKQGKAIEEVVRQRQKLAFSDDELRSSLALLTAITGNVDEAMRRQTIAMDFARGANIDLGTASKLLGKVTDETVNVLGRYGIRVKEGADATEVLALVQQKFAGQSAAFANSTAGKWARFNNQIDNIKETIGAALLPVVSSLAERLATFLEKHEEDINNIVQAWSQFASSEIFPRIAEGFSMIRDASEATFEKLRPFFSLFEKKDALIIGAALLGTLSAGFLLIAASATAAFIAENAALLGIPIAVAAATAAIILLVRHWDEIRAAVDGLVIDFQEKFPILWQIVEFVFGLIKARVQFWMDEARAVIKIVMALIHGDFQGAWQGINDMVNGFLNLIKADMENILRLIVGIVKSVLPDDLLSKPFDVARQSVRWLIDKINDLIAKIQSIPTPGDIFGGITGGIGKVVPFAEGGIVTKPTVALIGESGPEAVMPLDKAGNSIMLNVSFNSTFSSASPDEMNRAAIQLKALLRGAL